MLIGANSGHDKRIYRGLKKTSWADPTSNKLLPVAFYRQILNNGKPEEGLSVLTSDQCPTRDDFKRIIPGLISCGVGSLPIDGVLSIHNLSIVPTPGKPEKGEIRGMPHPEDEMEASKNCAHDLSGISLLENIWERI